MRRGIVFCVSILVAAGFEERRSAWRASGSDKVCAVHGKAVEIGIGISGETLLVDVGQCQPRNGRGDARTTTQKHYDKMTKLEDSSHAKHFNYGNTLSCNGTCIPSKVRYERHTTRTGLVEIPIVTDCMCATNNRYCRKDEKLATFHPGTPFEATIDVGTCFGSCDGRGKSSCKPIRNRTLAVEGPNGFSTVSVIEECACGSPCYRTSRFEHIFDYANVLDRNGTRIPNMSPDVKIIDIGECSGSCEGDTDRRCAMWSTDVQNFGTPPNLPPAYALKIPSGPKKCLAYLSGRTKTCTPIEYAAHLYTDSILDPSAFSLQASKLRSPSSVSWNKPFTEYCIL